MKPASTVKCKECTWLVMYPRAFNAGMLPQFYKAVSLLWFGESWLSEKLVHTNRDFRKPFSRQGNQSMPTAWLDWNIKAIQKYKKLPTLPVGKEYSMTLAMYLAPAMYVLIRILINIWTQWLGKVKLSLSQLYKPSTLTRVCVDDWRATNMLRHLWGVLFPRPSIRRWIKSATTQRRD